MSVDSHNNQLGTTAEPTFTPCGDSAFLIESPVNNYETKWSTAHSIATSLRAAHLRGISNIVATFSSVLVEFDPLHIDPQELREWVLAHGREDVAPYRSGRTIEIPLHYGGEYGPDLSAVANDLDLSETEVIEAHSATKWRVSFLGAPAGAPLHESEAFKSPIPRMSHPRTSIPAGSIALAGHKGTIYTINAPGGWRLIGRTPLRIVNASGTPFTVIGPGDVIAYTPISANEYLSTSPIFIGDLL